MSPKYQKSNRQIVVKSNTKNLSSIRLFVKDNANSCGCEENITKNIMLAVDEACTNIIKHAYKKSSIGDINISIDYSKKKFKVSIIDSGDPFNPNLISEPDIKQYYKEHKVGGLGVFLMRKLMDEVSYFRTKDNKNKVILVKYLK